MIRFLRRLFRRPLKSHDSSESISEIALSQTEQDYPPEKNDTADQGNKDHHLPYDADLLEKARKYWQIGDWKALTDINHETLYHHPDRAKLALLAASGYTQSGNINTAKKFIALAKEWGCDNQLIAKILIAGVHNTLGRAVAISGKDEQRALEHFRAALDGVSGTNRLAFEARVTRELGGIGLPAPFDAPRLEGVPRTSTPVLAPEPEYPRPPGGITSYAQNFEDVMLWRALGHVEKGFYIDIGAWDPDVDSVSKAFYEKGWRGVHVEPLPAYAEALRAARRDERVYEVALSDRPGEAEFYEIPETGLSTGDRSIAEHHTQAGFEVRRIVVPCMTLAQLFEEIGPCEIHWMKIDVEGMERQLLKGWGTAAARPWIVVVESTFPLSQRDTSREWEWLITSRGYRLVYFDGLNRFYLHHRREHLAPAFATGPNVFDGFRLARKSSWDRWAE